MKKKTPLKKYLNRAMSLALTFVMIISMTSFTSAAAAGRGGNENYYSNQGALQDDAFVSLPLSAVKAKGFLETQLLLQKAGITGNMALFRNYNAATSSWLNPNNNSGENWEKGMYYLRGLISVAYTLEDPELMTIAQSWIEGMITSSTQNYSNGLFGRWGGDWWPYMPALMALRDYYEYTEAKGNPDNRIITLITNYLQYEAANLGSNGLTHYWDAERAADNVDSVLWLYNRTYDSVNPSATQWLLNLASALQAQTVDWVDRYNNQTARYHIVNTTQGLKAPGVYWQLNGQQSFKDAVANGIFNYSLDHGRIDWMVNADEGAMDNQSTVGTESCAVVEGILSMAINERIFGEAWIGDWIERVAYNALPAVNSPDGTSQVYFNTENQILATLGYHDFSSDGKYGAAYGSPGGYECCFPNHQMGWGKFIQSMWMATRDNGLAVTVYGPNSVTAKVADGKTAKFDQDTDFPFRDDVRLVYGGDDGAVFPLKLRVPSWAANPTITVNGKSVSGVNPGEYFTIDRAWSKGDVINLVFTSEIKASTWYNNSVGIEKGALVYGLKIDEQWRTLEPAIADTIRSSQSQPYVASARDDFPNWETFPASPWNYGLVFDYNNPAASMIFQVDEEIPPQPFAATTSPVRILATGQRLPHWETRGNRTSVQPWITAPDAALQEPITLIPYGAGRLRVTNFPRIGTPSSTVVRTDILPVKHNGVKYTEVDNVVVPIAADYTLNITGAGSGSIVVNGRWSQALDLSSGSATITEMKGKLPGSFQFKENEYNNIRFTEGLTVSQIEVVPVSGVQAPISILSAQRYVDGSFRITTNIKSVIETRYHIMYGTEPGVYTMDEGNFEGTAANIVGANPEATYYAKAWAYINGVYTESNEYIVLPASPDGNLLPNPNAAPANYTLDANAVSDWTTIVGTNQLPITVSNAPPSIRFEDGLPVSAMENRKAYLNKPEAFDWTDYVVEMNITLDDLLRNNAGLMFRGNSFIEGANGFYGYYVGIGVNSLIFGYGDGAWHSLRSVPVSLQAGVSNNIKVVVYANQFAVYFNGGLVMTISHDLYSSGTIGLRSYQEAFTVSAISVRPVTEADLDVFETPPPSIDDYPELRPNQPDASYVGFGTTAQVNAAWQNFAPSTISVVDAAPDADVVFAQSNTEKFVLVNSSQTASDPLTWTDFVAETEIMSPDFRNNDAGFMIRATGIGPGADAYNGYYVGLGSANNSAQQLGVCFGYANGGWNALKVIPWDLRAGQTYTLKIVAYDNIIAAFVDGRYVSSIDINSLPAAARYNAGTIGLRSWNTGFTSYSVKVRNLIRTDLAFLADAGSPYFYDNFNGESGTPANWTLLPSNNGAAVSGGVLSFPSSTQMKVTTGSTSWTDYVAEGNVRIPDAGTTQNAGFMIRATDVGAGADQYNGYYFGISATGWIVGYADGSWHQLATGSNGVYIQPRWNHLKVIAMGTSFYYYINGVLVYKMNDTRFANGQIGLRSYSRTFYADEILVRPVSEQDKSELDTVFIGNMTVNVVTTSANVVRLIYTLSGSNTYRVVWGPAPGVYTNALTNLNAGGGTRDTTTFEVADAGTWYARMYAVEGAQILAVSPEFTVTTGETAPTADFTVKLNTAITAAKAYDTSDYTETSANRLTKAIDYAEKVAAAPASNRMELSTARQLLIGCSYGGTQDPDYGALRVYIEKGNNGNPEYYIVNSSDAANAVDARLIIAAYDSGGRLSFIDTVAKTAVSGTAMYYEDLTAIAPVGGSVKAFIWDDKTYVPLTPDAKM